MNDARALSVTSNRTGLLAQIEAHVVELLGEEDPEFVADLIDTFVECARESVGAVRAARAAGDMAALGAAAHSLRGSASNVGLTGLFNRWTEVEENARRATLSPGDVEAPLAETERALETLAQTRAA